MAQTKRYNEQRDTIEVVNESKYTQISIMNHVHDNDFPIQSLFSIIYETNVYDSTVPSRCAFVSSVDAFVFNVNAIDR